MIGGKIDSKTVGFFFSKSVKKSVKCGERVLRAGTKTTVCFPYSKFVPTRRFKNVVQLSKI